METEHVISKAPSEPPFSKETHLCASPPTAEDFKQIQNLRTIIKEKDHYDEEWATDAQLHRCLIAKQYNMDVATNLVSEAMKWRKKRAPHLIENTEGWQRAFELEGETGKMYSPGEICVSLSYRCDLLIL